MEKMMSVPLPQLKTRKLTTSDFVSKINHKKNGIMQETVADFYSVSDKEKEVLFTLEKGFHDISQKMIKKTMSVSQYLVEIEKLNQLMKEFSNIKTELDDNKRMVISLECELKPQYQNKEEDKEQKKEQKVQTNKPTIFALYGIEWQESEKGWGIRPDGFSFHRTQQESEQFIKDFSAKQSREVPDEYSRPLGKARLIEVSEQLHDYVVNNGSVWLAPKNEEAYKTYDTSHLNQPKNKM
jgi:hypothetical protein